jgi:hypothetical protein
MTPVPPAFSRRPEGTIDPLRFCVATTVAAISWLITPPLAVAAFGSIGLYSYWKARRAGLLKSRCLLGDTRWVMVYLVALVAGGIFFTVSGLTG